MKTHMISLVAAGLMLLSGSSMAAGPIVHLTGGGHYTTADGATVTCAGSKSNDVACFCDQYSHLYISRGKLSSNYRLADYKSQNECLAAVRDRPDCN